MKQNRVEPCDVIRIALQKCRSLLTMQRRMKLDILLRKVDPGIMCFTKTWFDSGVNDCKIFLNRNYQMQKRTDGQTGTDGVFLFLIKPTCTRRSKNNRCYREFVFNICLSFQRYLGHIDYNIHSSSEY